MESLKIPPELQKTVVTYGVRIVGAIVFLIIAMIVAGSAKKLVYKGLRKANLDETIAKFLSTMVRYLVLVMAVLACLNSFGIETTSFAAVLGASSLAIGLALQGSLSHLASGVMLLIFRPFKVGDVVTTGGITAKVEEIELFTTKLVTPDNRLFIVPNGAVFGSTIENITAFDIRRCDVAVGVDYGADVDKSRSILEETAKSIEQRLPDRDIQVVLTGLGASSVDFQLRVWVKTEDYWAVKDELTRRVKYELDKAGIGIPFPQVDVHFDPAGIKLEVPKAS